MIAWCVRLSYYNDNKTNIIFRCGIFLFLSFFVRYPDCFQTGPIKTDREKLFYLM